MVRWVFKCQRHNIKNVLTVIISTKLDGPKTDYLNIALIDSSLLTRLMDSASMLAIDN